MAEINISRESEEVVEMFCEYLDEHGNKNQPAEGFCVNCVKYFCATCLRYHRGFLPDHVTQDKGSMPVDVYLEKCKQHPEEIVKFYCISCEETTCHTCKTIFHKHCEDIHHLPKLASEFDKEKQCCEIENSLDLLEKEMADIEASIGIGKQHIEQYNTAAVSKLRKQKEDVETIFNNFEQEIRKLHTANKNLLNEEEKSKDFLKADINNLKTETEELKNSSQKCKIFLKSKNVKDETKQIKEKLGAVKTRLDHGICKYSYQLAGQKIKPESFGRVVVEPQEVVKANRIPWSIVLLVLALSVIFGALMLTGNTHITVEILPDIKVSFKIKQICYLSEHSLLILNYKKKVHVYNPKDSNWTGEIYRAELTDITRVRDDMVIATFSGNAELWSISSSQSQFSLELVKRMDVGEKCKFTQYRAGNLFHLCPEQEKQTIKIFDDNENKLHSFIIKDFSVEGMAVSPDGKTIYISTLDEGSITSYTTEGKVIAQYKNESLEDPCRMTVDSMGNLFVCGLNSNNIFYISADLTHGYEILNENHGIKFPYSINYNERDNILYVSSYDPSPIKVFKIKTRRFPYFL